MGTKVYHASSLPQYGVTEIEVDQKGKFEKLPDLLTVTTFTPGWKNTQYWQKSQLHATYKEATQALRRVSGA